MSRGRVLQRLAVYAMSGIAVVTLALLWMARGVGPAQRQGAADTPAMAAGVAVEEVIQRNLAEWRFKPGEEVFVHESVRPPHYVAMCAVPDGSMFLAWQEGYQPREGILVAGCPDGEEWRAEGQLEGERKNVSSVAIATNSGGEVMVAWTEREGCFAALRSAEGEWGAPEAVWQEEKPVQAQAALTAAPDGSFYLLATAPGQGGRPPEPRFSRWQPDGGWREVPGMPWEARGSHAGPLLGHRENLISVVTGRLVEWRGADGWQALADLPWEEPDKAQRTSAIWIRPEGRAAALSWSLEPVQSGAHLHTSEDLVEWSSPAFLGCIVRQGQGAVVCAAHGTYVATTYQPWEEDRGQKWGHEEVRWAGPRVFRIDEGLTRDTDGDGLTDITEEWLLTDHQNPDTDGDEVGDEADLDPLAATTPDTDEAKIRQAVLTAAVRGRPYPLVVVTPVRQAFAEHEMRVLCLTPEEHQGYRAKYGWAMTFLEVIEVQMAEGGETATVKWGQYSAPLAAHGGEAKLERRDGAWVVTDLGMRWVS